MSKMANDNLSAVLYEIDDLRMEQREIRKPSKGEVQIEVHSVGICGSDVHYLRKGRIGDFIVTAPMVLGHETSGIVSAVGDGVTKLKIGDRVAVEPGYPCRMCDFCKTGRYNLCADMKFAATPPFDGTLCRYYCHPADFCFKLPDSVSFEEGALLEPLSVGVHACRRAGITMGDTVLVCGAGPIGLVNLLVAKSCGASQVAITDLDEKRLKVAKDLGADHVITVERGKTAKEVASKVKKLLGKAPNKVIECTGAESSIITGIYAAESGGVVVIVGMGKPEVKMPVIDFLAREVDIRGIFRYANCYPTALSLVASGAVNVKPLVTNRFKLEDSVKAFEAAERGEGIKVIIKCKRDDDNFDFLAKSGLDRGKKRKIIDENTL
ncbi:sorbitol dehydrogenase-like [Xenia sp. Carnegie-2017]|uniref:sorbitol dehydrogenase-like n=1 Tax=Xenia sp. Carnegie-2017 TaxID=2897299 RepID=UPI001F039616|nr:sorbitol dehydrogenase-like [Xenia sp. Carnegie-2017]